MRAFRAKSLFLLALFLALGPLSPPAAAAESTKSKIDARLRILQRQGPSPAALDEEPELTKLFIRLRPGVDKSYLRSRFPRGEFRTQVGAVVTAAVPLDDLVILESDPNILGLQGSKRMSPNMNVVRSNDLVGGYIGGVLPHGPVSITSVSVSSVIIGFVDSGIDYSHGDFITAAGKSRIRFIWDQTTNSACVGAPSGYSYGDEWTQSDIESKIADVGYCLTQEDTSGHGSLVASIAAGDGSATNGLEPAGTYAGIAPSAEIIMVKTSYDDSDIIDAIAYIIAKASALGKKAVVNLSLGGQSGPHDGTDAFDAAVGGHAAGTPVVASMGNEHADNPHALINVLPSGTTTVGVDLALSPNSVSAEFWHDAGDEYLVNVSLDGVSGSTQTAFNSSIGPVNLGGYSVYIDNAIFINPNGDEDIYVKVDKSPSLSTAKVNVQFTRAANGANGRIDGFLWWSTKSQTKFASHSDDAMTIATPATAPNVIAVGSYASKNSWTSTIGPQSDSAVTLGTISSYSNRGPTRDGRVKPDLTAPGEYIGGVLSINSDPASNKKIQDGKHRVNQGTSFSAPIVSGLIALKYAVSPTASLSDIKAHFNAAATTDTAVGTATPGNTWGYGKVRPPMVLAAPSSPVIQSVSSFSITWGWGLAQYATTYAVYNSTDTSYIGNTSALSYARTGLYPNTLYAGRVHGNSGVGGNGPVAVTPSTYTLSAPAVPVGSPEVYISSILVNFTPVTPPSALVNFVLEASPNSDFSAGVIRANGMYLSASSITVAGLAASTAYHLRLGTLNSAGVTNYSYISPPAAPSTTGSPVPAAPAESPFTNVSTSTLRFNWALGTNSSGLAYQASISSSADFMAALTTVAVTTNLYTEHSNLFLNTTYYFKVKSGAGPAWSTAAVTWALPPTAATVVSTFSAVAATSLRVNWSSATNPSGTWFEAQLSTHSDFSSAVLSSVTKNLFADLGSAPLLPVNTTHYAQIRARSHGGVATAFLGPSSTATLAQPLAPPAPPYFTNLTSAGLTAYYLNADNPAGTSYLAELSTASNFSVINHSTRGVIALQSPTVSQEVPWLGLGGNQIYYFRVAAVNRNNVPTGTAAFTAVVTTATQTALPAASDISPSSETESALTVLWNANNASGTLYTAELSSNSSYAGTVLASATRNSFASFTDLWANTTYFLRVKAHSLYPPNPDSPFVNLSTGGVTLAEKPPAPPLDSLISITYSSITLRWTPLPSSPSSKTCEGYRLEASTSAGFSGTIYSSAVAGGASVKAAVGGLKHSTTYFLRLGSLNWQGDANFTSFGSTRTMVPLVVTSSVSSGQPISIAVSTLPFTQIRSIKVEVPADSFPAGTSIEINPNVELDIPEARTNQGRIVFLGQGVGVSISAGGAQPLRPVAITVEYDPALGQDANRLVMARYDENSGQWMLLSSRVDTLRKTVVGYTDHFSFFTPVLVTPASGVDSINVFPIPWEPAGDDPLFNSLHVSFTNLPPDASLRIYNVTGELIWQGRSALSGTWHWDGENSRGKKVGSGSYIAVVEWNGRKAVKRFVVIR